MRILHLLMLCLVGQIGLADPAQGRAGCEFFSEGDWTGGRVVYNLPNINIGGQPWSNVSRRFEGANLKRYATAIYKNAESVRITADGSDVTLYVYNDDNYKGRFQTVRAREGGTIRWRFGSMANEVRSIACQRDDFDAPAIPTSLVADAMTARVHDKVRQDRSRFYDHRIDIRQGRLSWENGYELCRSVNCVQIADPDRRKYWDFLRYSYKARGRLKADGRNYTISIDIWLEPFVQDGRLRFRVDASRVSASNGIWKRRVREAVEGRLNDEIDSIGPMLEAQIREEVGERQGALAEAALDNLRAISLGYSCDAATDRVGYPNYNYSQEQLEGICDGTTPDSVVAPSIRLHF